MKKITAGIFGSAILGSILIIFAFTSIGVSTNLQITEQERVDADLLALGLTNIDGKWWDAESLKIKNFVAQEGIEVPFQLGGWLLVEHFDINGNLISTQEIHNRVVDEGEDFIIDQTFKEGDAGETVDADQLASICVTAEVGFVDTLETLVATVFDTNDNLTETNCIADTSVTQSGQTAVIGALTFTGGTHVANDDTITGIGICQGSGTTPFNQCADAQAAASGILFSTINISDVTLAASETVDITYTMDYSSSGS